MQFLYTSLGLPESDGLYACTSVFQRASSNVAIVVALFRLSERLPTCLSACHAGDPRQNAPKYRRNGLQHTTCSCLIFSSRTLSRLRVHFAVKCPKLTVERCGEVSQTAILLPLLRF